MLDRDAALRLADALVGIESRCHRVGLAAVGIHLRARDAKRILGLGLFQRVGDQGHLRVLAGLPAHLRVALLAVDR